MAFLINLFQPYNLLAEYVMSSLNATKKLRDKLTVKFMIFANSWLQFELAFFTLKLS